MTKQGYMRENAELAEAITTLKKRLPKTKYEIKTSDGTLVVVEGHGYNYRDDRNAVTIWTHPWEDVATYIHPIYIKEK